MTKLCTFSEELADRIEAYQKKLGLRSFQTGVEVICAQFLEEHDKQKSEEEDKPS